MVSERLVGSVDLDSEIADAARARATNAARRVLPSLRDVERQKEFQMKALDPLRLLLKAGIVLVIFLTARVGWADEVPINLEWRPATQTVYVGDTVEIGLYAVAAYDDQLFRALDMVFTWDPDHLELLGVDDTGAVDLLYSGLPADDPYNLNETVPPEDGDGYYRAWANLGEPVVVTTAGVLLTTFQFTALSPACETVVDIPPSGGDPLLETTVWGGPGANTNVTGTLGDAEIEMLCMPRFAGRRLLVASNRGVVAYRFGAKPESR
jgi:hypothetical protein